jgi:hypothetical protein
MREGTIMMGQVILVKEALRSIPGIIRQHRRGYDWEVAMKMYFQERRRELELKLVEKTAMHQEIKRLLAESAREAELAKEHLARADELQRQVADLMKRSIW